jgi:Domain of unknown function (DUF4352)
MTNPDSPQQQPYEHRPYQQQPYQQQPYQQQPYRPGGGQHVYSQPHVDRQPPVYAGPLHAPQRPKKRRIWPWVVGGVILLIIIIGSVGNGSKGSSSASGGTSSSNSEQKNVPPAFPGATKDDVVVPSGQSATLDGLTLSSSQVKVGDRLFGKRLCTNVSYANGASRAVSFNGFDWKLQDPNGTILTMTIGGSNDTLNSGELAPGGKVSGDVCFEDKGPTSGQWVVLYEKSFFSNGRVAWLNQR